MGLGKTLQGVALIWTLLQSGHEALGGSPVCKRAMIVCPTSLVNNWDSECKKWLQVSFKACRCECNSASEIDSDCSLISHPYHCPLWRLNVLGRVQGKIRSLPLCESSRDDVIHSVKEFLSKRRPYDVLIVSYETFRIHAGLFAKGESVDLLVCDEAHRLKNDETKTNKALDSLTCRRRVLLSGTPMQNHLDEVCIGICGGTENHGLDMICFAARQDRLHIPGAFMTYNSALWPCLAVLCNGQFLQSRRPRCACCLSKTL
jgi:DNA repair and recombination protein RAD54 and RAD54-like protein